eukprot:11176223-Ditylum_brightwellii.AAC.1
MVWIDQNNPTVKDNNPTSYCQWAPAVVMHCSDTPPSVTCIVASCPYQKPPTFTSSWKTMKTFNMVDAMAIEADEGA